MVKIPYGWQFPRKLLIGYYLHGSTKITLWEDFAPHVAQLSFVGLQSGLSGLLLGFYVVLHDFNVEIL